MIDFFWTLWSGIWNKSRVRSTLLYVMNGIGSRLAIIILTTWMALKHFWKITINQDLAFELLKTRDLSYTAVLKWKGKKPHLNYYVKKRPDLVVHVRICNKIIINKILLYKHYPEKFFSNFVISTIRLFISCGWNQQNTTCNLKLSFTIMKLIIRYVWMF